jgi:hypothetical protein
MFFNIDLDSGDVIAGWVAPDNPSATPRLLVMSPGRPDQEIAANQMREDIRDLGMHASGMVGFRIDGSIVPGLAQLRDLRLLEAETGLPIHGRFDSARHIERKLCLFDSSIMPNRPWISATPRHFALSYLQSERVAFETMIVLINNHFANSIFICGRSSFNRYASFLENNQFLRAALLRSPFEELAERLLFIAYAVKANSPSLISANAAGLESLSTLVDKIDFRDPKTILSAFRLITPEQRAAVASPMTRMLGANPDDVLERHHVSIALENLATMDAVGARSRYGEFRAVLHAAVGSDVLGPKDVEEIGAVGALAKELAGFGLVEDLLQHDVALYAFVEQALAAGFDTEDEGHGARAT